MARNLSQADPSDLALILRDLSEPLAAIVSNAQAGRRMLTPEAHGELIEALSDIAEDGKRAGDLVGRLSELLDGE